MASLVPSKEGDGVLRFVKCFLHGKDCRIRLGRCSRKQGIAAKRAIEDLIHSQQTSTPYQVETRKWLDSLPDAVHGRVAKYGLVVSRAETECAWTDGFVAHVLESKSRHVSRSSMQAYKNVGDSLLARFGGRLLRTITRQEVDAMQEWLLSKANRVTGRGLSLTTANKRLKVCREWFNLAHKKRWVDENPFDHLRGLDEDDGPAERKVFVPRNIVSQLVAHAPTTEWALLLVLWRYAGLRQLEPLSLRWSDIAWHELRMTVTAPKQTKARHRTRVIPIWPEVKPWIEKAFDDAADGAEWVITRYRYSYDTHPELRQAGSDIYRLLQTQIKNLGILPWPKLTQNLRASGETELMQSGRFAPYEIAYWWNHSLKVQEEHYLQITDDSFKRAVESGSCLAADVQRS